MKIKHFIFPIIVLLFATLSCEMGGVEFDPGIELTTCDLRCGDLESCQTSRGDLEKNQKVDLDFSIYGVNQDGSRDIPEGLKTINLTTVLTVDGEGSVKISFKDANGQTISAVASNGNPAELTADVSLVSKKEKPSMASDRVESMSITGFRVEAIDGPAVGVQLNLAVNQCISNWCTRTHPSCPAP